jgi:hypothetical protein
VISFCLLAVRDCVVPSVVWLSKFPIASKFQACEREAAPVRPVFVPFRVPRSKVVSWFRPS